MEYEEATLLVRIAESQVWREYGYQFPMNAHRVLILLIKWPEKWNIVHCEIADCSYGRLKELIKPHLSSSLPKIIVWGSLL